SPVLDINYGIGENLQLKYEVPYVFSRDVQTDEAGNEHTMREHGIGDSTIGVKYRFYDNDDTNLSLAVYPQVEFRSPGGVMQEGTTWTLPVLLTKDFEHESITANVSIEKTTGDPDAHVFAGFGVGTRLTDKLALLGDVVGQQLDSSDDHRLLLDAGVRFKIDEKQAVVGALGLDIDAGDGQRHRYLTIGYQRFIGK
ncbi:MAG TPA: transporter, partial [Thermoanaerobaculia bacterium]